MSEIRYFERELKDTGIVIREDHGLVCVQSIEGKITDLYWVPVKELKVGDKVQVFKTVTATGTWYVGEKYV
jgi:intein/homing endonuclease